jgi:hypothetical protein
MLANFLGVLPVFIPSAKCSSSVSARFLAYRAHTLLLNPSTILDLLMTFLIYIRDSKTKLIFIVLFSSKIFLI